MNLIGSRYLFCGRPLYPISVVAIQGSAYDWAAYIAGLPIYSEPQDDFLERVYRDGAKLTEEQARAFFPDVELRYRP